MTGLQFHSRSVLVILAKQYVIITWVFGFGNLGCFGEGQRVRGKPFFIFLGPGFFLFCHPFYYGNLKHVEKYREEYKALHVPVIWLQLSLTNDKLVSSLPPSLKLLWIILNQILSASFHLKTPQYIYPWKIHTHFIMWLWYHQHT